MSKRYFIKELVSNPVYDRRGVQVPFVTIGENYGYIELEQATQKELVEDLDSKAGKRGIVRASEAEVEELKKKFPAPAFVPPSNQLRLAPNPRDVFKRREVAAAGSAPVVAPLAPPPPPPPPAAPAAAPAAPASTAPAETKSSGPVLVEPARKNFKPRMGKVNKIQPVEPTT